MTLSQHVANFITTTTFSQLPTQLIARAKLHLLDTLGVALAGVHNLARNKDVTGLLFYPIAKVRSPFGEVCRQLIPLQQP